MVGIHTRTYIVVLTVAPLASAQQDAAAVWTVKITRDSAGDDSQLFLVIPCLILLALTTHTIKVTVKKHLHD